MGSPNECAPRSVLVHCAQPPTTGWSQTSCRRDRQGRCQLEHHEPIPPPRLSSERRRLRQPSGPPTNEFDDPGDPSFFHFHHVLEVRHGDDRVGRVHAPPGRLGHVFHEACTFRSRDPRTTGRVYPNEVYDTEEAHEEWKTGGEPHHAVRRRAWNVRRNVRGKF